MRHAGIDRGATARMGAVAASGADMRRLLWEPS